MLGPAEPVRVSVGPGGDEASSVPARRARDDVMRGSTHSRGRTSTSSGSSSASTSNPPRSRNCAEAFSYATEPQPSRTSAGPPSTRASGPTSSSPPSSTGMLLLSWGSRRASSRSFAPGVPGGSLATPLAADRSPQRSSSRHSAGPARRARTREDHLTAVRLWLAGTTEVSRSGTDFDAWAKRHNEQHHDTAPLPTFGAIQKALCPPWAGVLRVARGEVAVDDARARHLEDLISATGQYRLVAVTGIALMTGSSTADAARLARADTSPSPAVRLGPSDAWFVHDVEAHVEGRAIARRAPYELSRQLLDFARVSQAARIKPNTLIAGVHRRQWHLTPRPAGRVGARHFWEQSSVDAWLHARANPETPPSP